MDSAGRSDDLALSRNWKDKGDAQQGEFGSFHDDPLSAFHIIFARRPPSR